LFYFDERIRQGEGEAGTLWLQNHTLWLQTHSLWLQTHTLWLQTHILWLQIHITQALNPNSKGIRISCERTRGANGDDFSSCCGTLAAICEVYMEL
jgi:hypothetical protein